MPDDEWVTDDLRDEELPEDEKLEDDVDVEGTTTHRTPRYEIDSYGADMPVDMLVTRMEAHDIVTPPYQRQFVWAKGQASRFIESLLLGLPVPSIFLSKDRDNRMLIVDGQQRLSTLKAFFAGVWPEDGKPFQLTGVGPEFKGKTLQTLSEADRRQLRNAVIHAIVLKAEATSTEAVYFIFERINTGGTRLNKQEIRECIEMGDLISLLGELNSNPDWRTLFGARHRRGKDRELILRFLAFVFTSGGYKKPAFDFLNRFAHAHRSMDPATKLKMQTCFTEVMAFVRSAADAGAFKPHGLFNAPAFEAIGATLGRLQVSGKLRNLEPRRFASALGNLYADKKFSDAAFDRTGNISNVNTRLERAEHFIGMALDASASPK